MGSKSMRFKAAMLGIALAVMTTCAVAQVTWRNHQLMPAAFWLVQNENKLAEEIGADSKGQFRIVVLPAASSGYKMGEVLDTVSENLLQMGYVAGGLSAGQEQILELLDLPQFVPGDFEFRKKLWAELLPMYNKLLLDKYDVMAFDVIQYNPRRLYTKREVKRLADLKGLKIRALGPTDGAFIRALGAQPTATEWTEITIALQQGVIDGHMAADGPHLSMKFNELAPNIFDTENAGPSVFTVISNKALKALSKENRDLLLSKQAAYQERNRQQYYAADVAARKALLASGSRVHPVSAAENELMRKQAIPIVEGWAKRLDARSRPIYEKARAMVDAYHSTKK